MIREYLPSDISIINDIGTLIANNFAEKNKLSSRIMNSYAKIFVYEENTIIKGFIEIEEHYEILDIINLAVSEEYQNQKIATKLLNYIISISKAERILLEVKETNIKALSFYKKNLFKEINRRKKYYDSYDAIIMERKIK